MDTNTNKLIQYLSDNHSDYLHTMLPEGYTFNEIAVEVMRMQSAIIRKHTHKPTLKVVK